MPGYGIACIDWNQQECGIAAALSGDPLMQAAYISGAPYISFAKQAGAVHAESAEHGELACAGIDGAACDLARIYQRDGDLQ